MGVDTAAATAAGTAEDRRPKKEGPQDTQDLRAKDQPLTAGLEEPYHFNSHFNATGRKFAKTVAQYLE